MGNRFKIIFALVILVCCFQTESQAQTPVYDRSKYYQINALETGSWSFRPKWWYTIFHNRYKRRYAPNNTRRSLTTASALIESEQYKKITEDFNTWKKEEEEKMLSRTVDMVSPMLGSKLKKINERINLGLSELIKLYSKNEDGLTIKNINRILLLGEERSRLCDNITIVTDSYIDNGKRLEGYMGILNELDELNSQINTLCYLAYNKAVNKGF